MKIAIGSKLMNLLVRHKALIVSIGLISLFLLITILSYGVPGCGGEENSSQDSTAIENEDDFESKYSAPGSNMNIEASKLAASLDNGKSEFGIEAPTGSYIDVSNFEVPKNVNDASLSINLVTGNYYAKPNDENDDTEAIQQAIYLALYNSRINPTYNIYNKGPITIFFPRGKYKISKQLVVDMKGYSTGLAIRMIGDWAHIVADSKLENNLKSLIQFSFITSGYVSGFIFDANQRANHAITGYKIIGGIFERIVATGALSHGIEIGPTHAYYRQISSIANGDDGWLIKGANGSTFSEISASFNKKNGITFTTYIESGTTWSGGCLIENFVSYKNQGDGIHISSPDSVSLDVGKVLENLGNGIYIDGHHVNVKKTYIKPPSYQFYSVQRAIRVTANGIDGHFESNSSDSNNVNYGKISIHSEAAKAYFSEKNRYLAFETNDSEDIGTSNNIFPYETEKDRFIKLILQRLKGKKKIVALNNNVKYFSIESYGATAQSSSNDNTEDDGIAISNAIDAALSTSTQINKQNVVYVPRGIYHISSPILIDGNLKSKKLVILSDFGQIAASPNYSLNDSLITVKNFNTFVSKRISINADKKSDYAFYVQNIGQKGRSLIELTGFINSLITGSYFDNSSNVEMVCPGYVNTFDTALHINNSKNFTIRRMASMHNHGTSVFITGDSKALLFRNTWLERNSGHQFIIGQKEGGDNISNISIQYGWLEGNEGDTIRIYEGDNIIVEGLRIVFYNACFRGIKFMRIYNEPQNVIVSGNRMNGAMTCHHWIVESNTYRDCYGSVEVQKDKSNVLLKGNFDLDQKPYKVLSKPVAPPNTKPSDAYPLWPNTCSFIQVIPHEKWPIEFDHTPITCGGLIHEHITSEAINKCNNYVVSSNDKSYTIKPEGKTNGTIVAASPSNVWAKDSAGNTKILPGFHVGDNSLPLGDDLQPKSEIIYSDSAKLDKLHINCSLINFSRNNSFFLYQLPCEENINIIRCNPYTMELSSILSKTNPTCSDLEAFFNDNANGEIYYDACWNN